jgi:hypothetical protein
MNINLLHGKAFGSGTNKLRTTGSLLHVKSSGKTWVSEQNVSRIREAFQRSPHNQFLLLAVDMLQRTDVSPDLLHPVCFLDEVTFHVNGVVNRYNCRIWGTQNPHVTRELERGSPKVNVWVSLMPKLIGTFFFSIKTVTGHFYLDMLEPHALPQLPPQTILQQYGVPPYFCHHVRNHLNRVAGRWISKGEPIAWPPRSPDLTPLDFFLLGLCEEHCLPG